MPAKVISMVAVVAVLGGCASPALETPATPISVSSSVRPADAFQRLEKVYAARLGVYAIDTGSERVVSYRAGERFAHCSTYKALMVGLLLQHSTDADLGHVVHYGRADLLEYAPVTSKHVDTGMTVRDLMAAAIEYSDNTAANLLLARAGGNAAVQRGLRALGDATTTVNRDEPSLNDAAPGDVRDTSVPRDLALDLRRLVLGTVLAAPRRTLLKGWLLGNTTGAAYIRAGVPAGWVVGDKTGSGGYGTRNDIAVVWPQAGAPLVIAIESDRGKPDAASDDALIAQATKIAVANLR